MWNKEGEALIVERKLRRHRISLTYPEVIGLKNKEIQKSINELIQEEIYKMIVEEGYEEDYKKEFWGEYDLKLQTEDFLSIVIYLHSYSRGATHGLTALKAINVDLQEGNVHQVTELFTRDSDYMKRINQIIKEEIIERKIPLLVEFETIDKKQDYYLTKEGLVIFFQLYEYTPYAYGIPEFKIPYTIIKDIIDEKGSLKNIIVQ